MSKAKQLGDLMLNWNSSSKVMEHNIPTLNQYMPITSGTGQQLAYYGTVGSAAASSTHIGFYNITFEDKPYAPKFMTISFQGYISSGTYYWSWRLRNTTQGFTVPVVNQFAEHGQVVHETNNLRNSTAQIEFWGNVHQMSDQPWVSFDCSSCNNGDTLQIQLSADNDSGTVFTNGSQTLYADDYRVWYGIFPGIINSGNIDQT